MGRYWGGNRREWGVDKFNMINGWKLPEGGDFEVRQCQPTRTLIEAQNFDLTTEPTLLGRDCSKLAFFLNSSIHK